MELQTSRVRKPEILKSDVAYCKLQIVANCYVAYNLASVHLELIKVKAGPDLTLGTNEREVESHRRGRLQI